jgi:hypothetical protein
MAYPTNPTNGQIYKDRVFSTDRWIKKENYDFGDGASVGNLRKIPFLDNNVKYYFTSALSQGGRYTYDCSSMVPVGTKTVTVKAMLHATPSSTSAYAYVILGFSESNIFVSDYNKNNPQVSLIGDAYSTTNGYVGNGGEEVVIRLDANRKFYGHAGTCQGVTTSSVYIAVTGYYI